MKTNKSNKKVVYIMLSIPLIMAVVVCVIYYYLGIGFGNAVVETAKGIEKAKEEWAQEGVNPMDTIKEKVMELSPDSTKNEE